MEMCVPPPEPARALFLYVVFTLASRVCTGLVPFPPENGTVGLEWMADTHGPSTSPTRDARGWVRPRAAVNPYL